MPSHNKPLILCCSYDSNMDDSREGKKNRFSNTMVFMEEYLNHVLHDELPFHNQEKNKLTYEVPAPVCLSTCLPVYVLVCLPVCLSNSLPVCLPGCLPSCPSSCLPVFLSLPGQSVVTGACLSPSRWSDCVNNNNNNSLILYSACHGTQGRGGGDR